MENRRILEAWKEVAVYLRRSEKTCRNWERVLGLPVHRLGGSPKARVFAYPEEIDRWMEEKLHEHEASPKKDSHSTSQGAKRLMTTG